MKSAFAVEKWEAAKNPVTPFDQRCSPGPNVPNATEEARPLIEKLKAGAVLGTRAITYRVAAPKPEAGRPEFPGWMEMLNVGRVEPVTSVVAPAAHVVVPVQT